MLDLLWVSILSGLALGVFGYVRAADRL